MAATATSLLILFGSGNKEKRNSHFFDRPVEKSAWIGLRPERFVAICRIFVT
jgi:hypothetical protein